MESSKSEKLALARKKLREFESRRHGENGSPVPSAASSICNEQMGSAPNSHSSDPNGRLSAASNGNHSGICDNPLTTEAFPSAPIYAAQHQYSAIQMPSGVVTPALNGFYASSSQQLEVDNLKTVLREKDAEHESLKRQLDELRSFYAQLHSAYNEMSTQKSNDAAALEQVSQLQTALSGLVSEKTALQTELRSVREELEEYKAQLSIRANHLAEETTITEKINGEVSSLRIDLDEKNRMLERRSAQLEAERKESAVLQTQMLTLQHDKNEAQARLKNVYKEKEAAEAELKNVLKDCQMKDLYLKQLGAHAHNSLPAAEDAAEKQKLQEECNALKAEGLRLAAELLECRKEAEETRRQFDEYGRGVHENLSRLHKELDDATSVKLKCEERVCELENELAVLREALQKHQLTAIQGSVDTLPQMEKGISEDEAAQRVEDAVRRVTHFWEQNLEQVQKEAKEVKADREQLIIEREQRIAELELKLRLADERGKEIGDASSELLSLSEQLQNEKATVSRAVAQNKELKEQLLETEDRLIKVMEEKADCELARQTAEHLVKELQRIERHSICPETETSSSSAVPADLPVNIANDVVAEHMHEQDEQDLRRELDDARRVVEQLRTELRRSHTQNEQMNQIMRQNAEDENQNSIVVELEQAVARVNALAHDNETLREEVESLRYSRLEEEDGQHGSIASPSSDANAFELEAATRRIHQLHQDNEDLSERVNHLTRLLDEANSQLESTRLEESLHVQRNSPPVSPVLSEPNNIECKHQRPEEYVGSAEWARVELEKRFADAMRQIAELQERYERVEHINLQLQLENETIADHVILYQHQRRLIRERLRIKDEQMAALDKERERVLARCVELQQLLMQAIGDPTSLPFDGKPFRPRSYSHSTVDEFSGDEEFVVNGNNQPVPSRENISTQNQNGVPETPPNNKSGSATSGIDSEPTNCPENHNPGDAENAFRPSAITDREAAVQRILDILQDIKTPTVPLNDARMQCKQCIGELQHL